MITIFSCPKPFVDPHIAMIQRNAIRSWSQVHPDAEVIIYGDEEGTAATCAEIGVTHVPEITTNEFGTPLLDGLFDATIQRARHDLLCYVNGDILLFPHLLEALAVIRAQSTRFMAVGQRTDLDVTASIDFSAGWADPILADARANGSLAGTSALDYFCFDRRYMFQVPAFAIGRAGWDNYMLWRTRDTGGALVDVTTANIVVHQNHGYQHVSGGQQTTRTGDEAQRNLELAGGWAHIYGLQDATHMLRDGRFARALTIGHLRQRAFRFLFNLKQKVAPSATNFD